MPAPTFTLTGTHHHLDGTPQAGRVKVSANVVVRDVTDTVIMSGARTATLDPAGTWSLTLPADSEEVRPAGITYTVRFELDGVTLADVSVVAQPAGAVLDVADVVGEAVVPLTKGATLAELRASIDATAAAQVNTPGTLARDAIDAAAAAAAGVALRGAPGRRYAVVAGVLRNLGGPTYWFPLDDALHRCTNVDAVTTTATEVVIDFASLGASKVVSFVAVPDETLAAAGFAAGASVSLTEAAVTFTRHRGIADYVQYNAAGGTWSSLNNVFSGFAYANGRLSMTHAPIGGTSNADVAVTGRGEFLVSASASAGGATDTATAIDFRDYAGALVPAPATGMRAYVSRGSRGKVDPRVIDGATYPASNLWFVGVFEV